MNSRQEESTFGRLSKSMTTNIAGNAISDFGERLSGMGRSLKMKLEIGGFAEKDPIGSCDFGIYEIGRLCCKLNSLDIHRFFIDVSLVVKTRRGRSKSHKNGAIARRRKNNHQKICS